VAGRVDVAQRSGGTAESDGSGDPSVNMPGGGGSHDDAVSSAEFGGGTKAREQAGAISSPDEPRTPTREEGGLGHGRVSAAQTVLQAFRRSAAALSKAQPQSPAAHSQRDAVAAAPGGPHVQGLWLYPIKSCAAQVSACLPVRTKFSLSWTLRAWTGVTSL
jgi:hypothetical protein